MSSLNRTTCWALLLFGIALVSCDNKAENHAKMAEEYQTRLAAMEKSGVVAGPLEKTFEENHNVRLGLPLSEDRFLKILEELHLPYELDGQRGTNMIIPSPWHSKKLDMSKIQKAYHIYGKMNHNQRSREMYRAFVDEQGRVVYLENVFAYTGP